MRPELPDVQFFRQLLTITHTCSPGLQTSQVLLEEEEKGLMALGRGTPKEWS